MEKGKKYYIKSNIPRRDKIKAIFIRENAAGYFFRMEYGEIFIEKKGIKIKVKEL